jgi:hypothetical protein
MEVKLCASLISARDEGQWSDLHSGRHNTPPPPRKLIPAPLGRTPVGLTIGVHTVARRNTAKPDAGNIEAIEWIRTEINLFVLFHSSWNTEARKRMATHPLETSETTYPPTQRHIQEDKKSSSKSKSAQ